MRSFIKRRVEPAAVDDVLQEVFLACLTTGARFRGTGTTRAFLLGIARNRIAVRWRRRSRGARAIARYFNELPPGITWIDDEIDSPSKEVVARRALCTLPPRLREALVLTYWEGLTRDEVAARTHVSPGTVASRVRLGLARLRRDALGQMSEGLSEVVINQQRLDT